MRQSLCFLERLTCSAASHCPEPYPRRTAGSHLVRVADLATATSSGVEAQPLTRSFAAAAGSCCSLSTAASPLRTSQRLFSSSSVALDDHHKQKQNHNSINNNNNNRKSNHYRANSNNNRSHHKRASNNKTTLHRLLRLHPVLKDNYLTLRRSRHAALRFERICVEALETSQLVQHVTTTAAAAKTADAGENEKREAKRFQTGAARKDMVWLTICTSEPTPPHDHPQHDKQPPPPPQQQPLTMLLPLQAVQWLQSPVSVPPLTMGELLRDVLGGGAETEDDSRSPNNNNSNSNDKKKESKHNRSSGRAPTSVTFMRAWEAHFGDSASPAYFPSATFAAAFQQDNHNASASAFNNSRHSSHAQQAEEEEEPRVYTSHKKVQREKREEEQQLLHDVLQLLHTISFFKWERHEAQLAATGAAAATATSSTEAETAEEKSVWAPLQRLIQTREKLQEMERTETAATAAVALTARLELKKDMLKAAHAAMHTMVSRVDALERLPSLPMPCEADQETSATESNATAVMRPRYQIHVLDLLFRLGFQYVLQRWGDLGTAADRALFFHLASLPFFTSDLAGSTSVCLWYLYLETLLNPAHLLPLAAGAGHHHGAPRPSQKPPQPPPRGSQKTAVAAPQSVGETSHSLVEQLRLLCWPTLLEQDSALVQRSLAPVEAHLRQGPPEGGEKSGDPPPSSTSTAFPLKELMAVLHSSEKKQRLSYELLYLFFYIQYSKVTGCPTAATHEEGEKVPKLHAEAEAVPTTVHFHAMRHGGLIRASASRDATSRPCGDSCSLFLPPAPAQLATLPSSLRRAYGNRLSMLLAYSCDVSSFVTQRFRHRPAVRQEWLLLSSSAGDAGGETAGAAHVNALRRHLRAQRQAEQAAEAQERQRGQQGGALVLPPPPFPSTSPPLFLSRLAFLTLAPSLALLWPRYLAKRRSLLVWGHFKAAWGPVCLQALLATPAKKEEREGKTRPQEEGATPLSSSFAWLFFLLVDAMEGGTVVREAGDGRPTAAPLTRQYLLERVVQELEAYPDTLFKDTDMTTTDPASAQKDANAKEDNDAREVATLLELGALASFLLAVETYVTAAATLQDIKQEEHERSGDEAQGKTKKDTTPAIAAATVRKAYTSCVTALLVKWSKAQLLSDLAMGDAASAAAPVGCGLSLLLSHWPLVPPTTVTANTASLHTSWASFYPLFRETAARTCFTPSHYYMLAEQEQKKHLLAKERREEGEEEEEEEDDNNDDRKEDAGEPEAEVKDKINRSHNRNRNKDRRKAEQKRRRKMAQKTGGKIENAMLRNWYVALEEEEAGLALFPFPSYVSMYMSCTNIRMERQSRQKQQEEEQQQQQREVKTDHSTAAQDSPSTASSLAAAAVVVVVAPCWSLRELEVLLRVFSTLQARKGLLRGNPSIWEHLAAVVQAHTSSQFSAVAAAAESTTAAAAAAAETAQGQRQRVQEGLEALRRSIREALFYYATAAAAPREGEDHEEAEGAAAVGIESMLPLFIHAIFLQFVTLEEVGDLLHRQQQQQQQQQRQATPVLSGGAYMHRLTRTFQREPHTKMVASWLLARYFYLAHLEDGGWTERRHHVMDTPSTAPPAPPTEEHDKTATKVQHEARQAESAAILKHVEVFLLALLYSFMKVHTATAAVQSPPSATAKRSTDGGGSHHSSGRFSLLYLSDDSQAAAKVENTNTNTNTNSNAHVNGRLNLQLLEENRRYGELFCMTAFIHLTMGQAGRSGGRVWGIPAATATKTSDTPSAEEGRQEDPFELVKKQLKEQFAAHERRASASPTDFTLLLYVLLTLCVRGYLLQDRSHKQRAAPSPQNPQQNGGGETDTSKNSNKNKSHDAASESMSTAVYAIYDRFYMDSFFLFYTTSVQTLETHLHTVTAAPTERVRLPLWRTSSFTDYALPSSPVTYTLEEALQQLQRRQQDRKRDAAATAPTMDDEVRQTCRTWYAFFCSQFLLSLQHLISTPTKGMDHHRHHRGGGGGGYGSASDSSVQSTFFLSPSSSASNASAGGSSPALSIYHLNIFSRYLSGLAAIQRTQLVDLQWHSTATHTLSTLLLRAGSDRRLLFRHLNTVLSLFLLFSPSAERCLDHASGGNSSSSSGGGGGPGWVQLPNTLCVFVKESRDVLSLCELQRCLRVLYYNTLDQQQQQQQLVPASSSYPQQQAYGRQGHRAWRGGNNSNNNNNNNSTQGEDTSTTAEDNPTEKRQQLETEKELLRVLQSVDTASPPVYHTIVPSAPLHRSPGGPVRLAYAALVRRLLEQEVGRQPRAVLLPVLLDALATGAVLGSVHANSFEQLLACIVFDLSEEAHGDSGARRSLTLDQWTTVLRACHRSSPAQPPSLFAGLLRDAMLEAIEAELRAARESSPTLTWTEQRQRRGTWCRFLEAVCVLFVEEDALWYYLREVTEEWIELTTTQTKPSPLSSSSSSQQLQQQLEEEEEERAALVNDYKKTYNWACCCAGRPSLVFALPLGEGLECGEETLINF